MKRSTFYGKQADPPQTPRKKATGSLSPEVFPSPSPEDSLSTLNSPMPNVSALISHFNQFTSPPPPGSRDPVKTNGTPDAPVIAFDAGKVEEDFKKWIYQNKDKNSLFADCISNWSSGGLEKYSCSPSESSNNCYLLQLFPKRTEILPTRTSKATGSLNAAQVNDLLNAPVLNLDIEKVKEEFTIWRTKNGVSLNRFGEYILNMSRSVLSTFMLRHNHVKIEYLTRIHNWLKLDEKLKKEVWKLELYKNKKMIVCDAPGDITMLDDDDLVDDQCSENSLSAVPEIDSPEFDTTSSLDLSTEEAPGRLSSNLLAILNDFDSSQSEWYPKRSGILPTRTSKATGSLSAAQVNGLLNAPVLNLDIEKVKKEFTIWRHKNRVTLNRFGEYILDMRHEGLWSLISRPSKGVKSERHFIRMHNWLELDDKLKRDIWKLELFKNRKMIVCDASGDITMSDDDDLVDDQCSKNFPSSVPVPDEAELDTTSSLDLSTEEAPGQLSSNLLAILNDFDSSQSEWQCPERFGIPRIRTSKATGSLSAAQVNNLLNAPVLELDIEKVKEEFTIWRTKNGVSLNRFGEYILNMSRSGLSTFMLRHNHVKIEYLTRIHNWLKLDEKLKKEVWKMKLYKNKEMIVCDAPGYITMSDDDDLVDDQCSEVSPVLDEADLETTSSLDSPTEEDSGFYSYQRDCLYPKRNGILPTRTSKATGSLSAAQVNGLLNEPVLELDIEKVKKEFNLWKYKHRVALNRFGEYILDTRHQGLWSLLSRPSKGVKSERHFIRIHNWLKLDEKLKRDIWKLELFKNRKMIVCDAPGDLMMSDDDDLKDDQCCQTQRDFSYPKRTGILPTRTSEATGFLSAARVNALLSAPVSNLNLDIEKVKKEFTTWRHENGVSQSLFAIYIMGFPCRRLSRIMMSKNNYQSRRHFIRIHNWLKMDEELKRETWKLELFRNNRMILHNQSEAKIAAEIPSSSPTGISELSSDPPIAPNNLVTTLSVSHNEIPQDSRFKLLKMFYYDLPELPVFKTLIEATPSKFEWLVTFPNDPNSDFIPDTLFKYDFLPNVSFKLDNSISVPHVSFCGNDPIPFVDYDLHFSTHQSLRAE